MPHVCSLKIDRDDLPRFFQLFNIAISKVKIGNHDEISIVLNQIEELAKLQMTDKNKDKHYSYELANYVCRAVVDELADFIIKNRGVLCKVCNEDSKQDFCDLDLDLMSHYKSLQLKVSPNKTKNTFKILDFELNEMPSDIEEMFKLLNPSNSLESNENFSFFRNYWATPVLIGCKRGAEV